MVALSQLDTSRVYRHLGMAMRSNIDAGDVIRVQVATESIPDDYSYNFILELLDVCDQSWQQLNLATNSSFSNKEIFAGDINRTVIRNDAREQQRIWNSEYIRVTDELARTLGVANYQHEGMDRYRHEHNIGAALKVTRDPIADTSSASRRQEVMTTGGGFGYW